MNNFKRIRILIFLVFTSLFLFKTRDFDETSASLIDISNLHRILSLVILLFLSIQYNLTLRIVKNNNLVLKFYGIYIVTGFLSTVLFSDIILLSFWKLIEILSVSLAILYINKLCYINFEYFEYVFRLMVNYLKLIIIVSLVGLIIFPNVALQPPSQYQEAFLPYMIYGSILRINPNTMGLIAALIFIYSFLDYSISKKKLTNGLWILILVFVMVFAQSRTTLLALSLVYLIYVFKSKIISNFFKIFTTTVVFVLIYFNVNLLTKYIGRGYEIDHLSKLSGRLDWWNYAYGVYLDSSLTERLVGLGFNTANRNLLSQLDAGTASSLHSDYIDSLISSGVIGFSMIIFCFLTVIFNIYKKRSLLKYDSLFVKLSLMTILMFTRSFSGTTISFHNFFLICFLVLSIGIINYPFKNNSILNPIN